MRLKEGAYVSFMGDRGVIYATVVAVNGDMVVVRPQGQSYVVPLDSQIDTIDVII